MICEGEIAATTKTAEYTDDEGILQVRSEVVPAYPCDAEATVLARSMKQQTCNLGEVHWVKTEDHVYCPRHVVPGTMTHLDGRVTHHGPMAAEDA